MKSFKLIAAAVAAACAVTSAPASEPAAMIYYESSTILPSNFTFSHESQIITYEAIDGFYVATVLGKDFHETRTIYLPLESVMTGSIEEYKNYDGEWVSRDYLYETILHPAELQYENYERGQFQFSNLNLSQTFFNSDEAYEYVMPISKIVTETTEEDQNNDGAPDRITTYYNIHITGCKIMSDNGTTLNTIEFPEEIGGTPSFHLLQFNGERYLLIGYNRRDEDKSYYVTLYYHIPSDGSKLDLVRREESKVRTSQDGKNLIISFDGDCSYDNIEIFDAAGRKALGRNIDSTAKEASVNISDLSQGTYILRATSQSGEKMSCKIAIR